MHIGLFSDVFFRSIYFCASSKFSYLFFIHANNIIFDVYFAFI